MRRGERCISRAKECSGLASLWLDIFEIMWVVKNGSSLAAEGRDGARYWMLFGAV
jgi:hypothetical protein